MRAGFFLKWTVAHISRSGGAVLLLGLPGLAAVLGCAAVAGSWRKDRSFGGDLAEMLAIFGRHRAIALLLTATVLAAAIFVAVVAHLISD
jgi:hypothetical protein